MLDFICTGPVDCQERVESDRILNEKILPTGGLDPTTLKLEV